MEKHRSVRDSAASGGGCDQWFSDDAHRRALRLYALSDRG